MPFDPARWTRSKLSPLELRLDPENPRFRLVSTTQDAIYAHLIEHHNVVDLARRIADFGGLYPVETVLVYPQEADDGKTEYVVLEGNRRVVACKILLSPYSFAPKYELEEEFSLIDEELKKRLSLIDVEIVPSRREGDPVVANIHAIDSRRRWSTPARMRYIEREHKRGKNYFEIAEELHVPLRDVNQLMKGLTALRVALAAEWTESEKQILGQEESFDYDSFLRVALSPTIEKVFGSPFITDDGRENFFGHGDLMQKLQIITRHTLLAQRQHEERWVRINTNIESYLRDVFSLEQPSQSAFELAVPAPNPEPKATPQIHRQSKAPENSPDESPRAAEANDGAKDTEPQDDRRKPDESAERQPGSNRERPFTFKSPAFFDDLKSNLKDVRINQLVAEIVRVSRLPNCLINYPLACSMLMRSLLEWSLKLFYEEKAVWSQLKQGQRAPTIEQMLRLGLKRGLFPDRIATKCDHILQFWLDELNFNIHNDLGNYSPDRLTSMCADIKPVVRWIIERGDYIAGTGA